MLFLTVPLVNNPTLKANTVAYHAINLVPTGLYLSIGNMGPSAATSVVDKGRQFLFAPGQPSTASPRRRVTKGGLVSSALFLDQLARLAMEPESELTPRFGLIYFLSEKEVSFAWSSETRMMGQHSRTSAGVAILFAKQNPDESCPCVENRRARRGVGRNRFDGAWVLRGRYVGPFVRSVGNSMEHRGCNQT